MFKSDFVSHLASGFESGVDLSDVFSMVLSDNCEYPSSASKAFTSSDDESTDSPPLSPVSFDHKLKSFIKEEPDSPNKSCSPMTLTRDELLKFSSETLDNLANSLSSTRPLTEEERKQFKKQKRLIKNRESAQLSRQRKKCYLVELEKQIQEANYENQSLIQRLNQLEEENRALRQDSDSLHLLRSSPEKLTELLAVNGPQKKLVENSTQTLTLTNSAGAQKKVGVKAAGVYLLVVLLSFGLFMNAKKGHEGDIDGFLGLCSPTLLPPSSSVLSPAHSIADIVFASGILPASASPSLSPLSSDPLLSGKYSPVVIKKRKRGERVTEHEMDDLPAFKEPRNEEKPPQSVVVPLLTPPQQNCSEF